jgi:fused signal recognition particle receptor
LPRPAEPTPHEDGPLFWRRKKQDQEPVPTEEPVVDDSWEPDEADWGEPEAGVAPDAHVAVAEPTVAEPTVAGPAPTALGSPSAEAPPAPWDPVIATPEHDAEELAVGVAKSRGGFMSRLRGIFGGGGPTAADWEEVEETLIGGDVGAALAIDVVERARKRRDVATASEAVEAELSALLVPREPHWQPLPAAPGQPAVLLIVGVNGTGKTTTIGKMAARYHAEGRSVLLAAADTFRAAAIEQLQVWASRSGVPVVAHKPGADPGAVVYDSLDAAVARGADLVIADTAGRLHTKVNLMDELTKIRRVVDRRLPGAQPETLFVLDATTGQNGLTQAKAFHDAVGLTGIVLTKLDSTSKGGIVFAIEHDLGIPVRFVGVGEKIGDLLPFDPAAFTKALFA